MKVRKYFLWLIAIFGLVFLTSYFAFPAISVIISSGGSFTILNDTAYLNWTNGYIFGVVINSTVNNNTITILNGSSYLTANYSQTNTIATCIPGNYKIFVVNATTGNYTSNTIILNATNTTTMNLVDLNAYNAGGINQSCAPGRYLTYTFTFANSTNSNENANITVITDIPVSTNNTLSTSTNTGNFSGILPANATTYHSFYFNTSAILNATAITLSLSGWSSTQNADMWLVKSGIAVAKSINQNTTDYLSYNFVPAGEMWEARIYGNSNLSTIPYTGYIIYSTLNVTNTSNTAQVPSIDFGTLNISGTSSVNVNLKNEGNTTLSNVTLTSNTYRTVRYGGSGSKSFSFLVGNSSIDSAIHVSLNWTGSSNYTLNLYNPSGNLVTTSSNYYLNALNSSVNEELFNDTTSIAQGYWTASVVSNSGSDDYNLTVFVYQPSSWITPNVTSFTSIAPFVSNVTKLNITVPNTIDGIYEGKIFLTDANNAQVTIPYIVNVTTPTLVIQNATMSPTVLNVFGSDMYRIDENFNSSLTRSFNLNLSNLGNYDLTIAITNSSGVLNCNGCSYTANLTLNSTNYIPAHSSQIINFNVTFNYSIPQATYDGWIYINATNSTGALSAHPYSAYNLTVRLNLTNLLYVQIFNFLSNAGDNVVRNNSGENVTALINVSYINATLSGLGTQIQNIPITNFTSVWLQEKNVTTSLGRIPSSGSVNYLCATTPFFFPNYYNLNFTIPANQPGGQYAFHTIVNYLRTSDLVTFNGEGINSTALYVNNTGLFMSTNAASCSFDSTCSDSTSTNIGGTLTITTKVANYGPLAASGATINLTTVCTAYTIAAGTSSGCGTATPSGTGSGTTWTLSIPAYNTSCMVSWTLTGSSVASSCAAAYLMGGGGAWFDPSGVNLTISVSNISTTSTSTSSSATGATQNVSSTTTYLNISDYTSIISVVQGTTNSTIVFVKNMNNTKTQNITLTISNLNSSWYSISPASRIGITPFSTTNFSITFTIPNDVAVADYIGNYIASSSFGSNTKSFTVRILPSNTTKMLINDTYQLYKLNYTQLYEEVNKSKAAGMNTSLVEADLALIKIKLDQAQTFINSDDYFSASQILNEAKNLLAQAQSDFGKITENIVANTFSNIFSGFKNNTLIYILIIGIGIAGIVVAYLFWPIKEGESPTSVLFKPKVGEKSPEDSVWQKLKNKWSWLKLKKKWGAT